MKSRPQLWRVAICTTPEAEDAVGEILGATLNLPVSSYQDLETGRSTLSVYSPNPLPNPADLRRQLAAELARVAQCGLDTGPAEIAIRALPRENWAESWKRHFKPLQIRRRLLVRPGWSRQRPRPGQALVVLDPGLSFGTGQHPTTSFCLEELVALARCPDPGSLLDIGTGSGILAIAAAKLGFAPVEAVDFDPVAVAIARDNARRNRVQDAIRFARSDIRRASLHPSRRWKVVCANLLADLLMAEAPRILARVAPGGCVLLAGILATEFSRVAAVYRAGGLQPGACRRAGEWQSGVFRMP